MALQRLTTAVSPVLGAGAAEKGPSPQSFLEGALFIYHESFPVSAPGFQFSTHLDSNCGPLRRLVRSVGTISATSHSPILGHRSPPGRSQHTCLSGPPAFVTAAQGVHPLVTRLSWPVRLVFVGLTGLEQADSSVETLTSQAVRGRDLFVHFQSCRLSIRLPIGLHVGADSLPPLWSMNRPWRTLNCWEPLRIKKGVGQPWRFERPPKSQWA